MEAGAAGGGGVAEGGAWGRRAQRAWRPGPAAARAGRASFIGSEKRVLRRVLGEKGVILTAEAQARLDALPDNFPTFIAAPERFFARPETEAAQAA